MDKWKDIELEKMKAGGNAKFQQFLESQEDFDPGWSLQEKYSSKAAALFRDKVRTRQLAVPQLLPSVASVALGAGIPLWVLTQPWQLYAVHGCVAPSHPSLGEAHGDSRGVGWAFLPSPWEGVVTAHLRPSWLKYS